MGDTTAVVRSDAAPVAPRLALRGIGKSFHGVSVLEDVDLDVMAGEVHSVVGENGAGKSTLMKIVAGVHAPTTGTITLDGKAVTFSHPLLARRAGVSIVYQELNLLPERTVTENMYLGMEPTRRGRLDAGTMERGAAEALHAAGAPAAITPRTKAKELGVADQQVIEIGRALMGHARLVIFDEPTAALSGAEAEELFVRIRQLRDAGIGVLYVSHRLPEVFALSDRVTVLKDGQAVGTLATADATRDGIVEMMVGRELAHYYPPRSGVEPVGETSLAVRGGGNDKLHDIDLDLRAGEILGVAGLAGSGRTELARALFGVEPFTTGDVTVGGRPMAMTSPRVAIRAGLAFVTEDRKTEGLVLGASAAENGLLALQALGRRRRQARLGGIDPDTRVDELLRRFELRTRDARQAVGLLSGGNQQKVVLAKWMATNATVMLFDEPTRGIDVGAKSAIHELLRALADAGLAVLMISSELPEVLGMSDRLVVMRDGTISGELPGGASETAVMDLATHDVEARSP